MIIQNEGFLIDSINMGLKQAKGDIIVFLDDDAIPEERFLEEHLESYELNSKIGGVAGNVIPALLNENGELNIKSGASEIISDYTPFLNSISRLLWRCPLPGMEDYLIYISKAGMVEYNVDMVKRLRNGVPKSLLGMGANMSVLSDAVKGLTLPRSWILGLSNEQYIGWYIWRRGYTTIFNPEAIVYHISHGETQSRNITGKKQVLQSVEWRLLFSRLYGLEPKLSAMHRITWVIFDLILTLKRKSGVKLWVQVMIEVCIIGQKWRLSRSCRENGLNDLVRLI
jgi:cellulose synthase/poly-beta-1,6-N-acetylglucosamine synthase-like glycosyltransferase